MSSADQPRGFVLPDAFLDISSVEQAIEEYDDAGLRPILVHATIDTADGPNCTCGQKHEKTKSGSSSAGKHPIAKNWQTHKASRDDLTDQRARLKFIPNIGMVLGEQAHGAYWIAVDVDDLERFAELEKELGPLPETIRCDSGRGYRLFYELPPEIDTNELKNVTGLSTGSDPISGVDVKAKGGQVVVAPSLHANGKRYVWTRAGIIAKLPMTWAIELVKAPAAPKWIQQTYTPTTLNADGRAKKRAEKYFEAAVIGNAARLSACGEGLRNNTLHRSAVHLFKMCANSYLGGSTWGLVHTNLFSAARACGLDEREIRATLASAEKWVVESGAVHALVALSSPDRPLRSVPPSETPAADSDAPPQEAPQDEPDRLPVIRVTTKLEDMVEASIKALRASKNLFQRNKSLVFITTVDHQDEFDPTEEQQHKSMDCDPKIEELTRPIIKGRLSRVAVYQKWVESAGGYKDVLPPEDVAAEIRDIHQYPGILPLTSVVETPFLRPDGVIAQNTGYDPKTRVVYLPNETFPTVHDEAATQENAQWAFKFISEIFEDFPFVNASHRSVPIAAILTLVARPAILGSVPGFLFDASTRGSGKTLQADVIATVATGRGAPRMNYTSNEEEMEKILAAYAIKGSPFICLDNIPAMRPFGGGPIDRVLTAKDKVDLRLLGFNEVPSLIWRAVLMATGNNIGFCGDTARRVIMARLESLEESPERRTKFKHIDLLAWVRTQRPRLVSAALLILRAYCRAGRPNMGCHWGSFEEWSHLIANAIVFAGGADPMKARPDTEGEVDVEAQSLSCVLEQLPKLSAKIHGGNGSEGLAARTIVAALYELQQGDTTEWAVFEPLKEAIEVLCRSKYGKQNGKPDPVQLGHKLRSMRKRVIGGKRLAGAMSRENVLMWYVEKLNPSA